MAGFAYANTTYPSLFSDITADPNGDVPKKVLVGGEEWIQMKYAQSINIDFSPCNDLYISLETLVPDIGGYGYNETLSIFLAGNIRYDNGNSDHDICGFAPRANADYSFLGQNMIQMKHNVANKFVIHIYKSGNTWYGDVETNVGSIKKRSLGFYPSNMMRFTLYFQHSGYNPGYAEASKFYAYFRNLIVSTSPISLSDTITEVPVKSVNGWNNTGDALFTRKVNDVTTVAFDENEIKNIQDSENVKQFVFCGIVEKQGEAINHMYADVAGKTFTFPVDYGNRFFGLSYGTETIPQTLTLTSKG